MIVSHKHKFIFLKTRKTAGTSMEIALSEFCGDDDIISPISPEDEVLRQERQFRGPQRHYLPLRQYRPLDWAHLLLRGERGIHFNHSPAQLLRQRLGSQMWDSYFKFCVERNPWDKAVSLYYYMTRDCTSRPTLLKFLTGVSQQRLSNFGIYSIDQEVAVDYVARYEDLANEVPRLAERLGLSGRLILPEAKRGIRKDRQHYSELMGPAERDIVSRVCAAEIKLFNYHFEQRSAPGEALSSSN